MTIEFRHTFVGVHDEDGDLVCVICDQSLGQNRAHFPDMLYDEGHADTCKMFCSDDDCELEHPCGGLSHYAE